MHILNYDMKFTFHIVQKDLILFSKFIKKKLFNLLRKHVASLKWKSERTLHFSTFHTSASTHSITLGLWARNYSCVCLQGGKKKNHFDLLCIHPTKQPSPDAALGQTSHVKTSQGPSTYLPPPTEPQAEEKMCSLT